MKRKPRSRLAIISVLLLGLIIFGGVYYAWNATFSIFQPVDTSNTKAVNFEVAKGDTATVIANKLKEQNLIRDPLAFSLWARIKGLDTHLQVGVYKLNPSMTISQIIDQLLEAQPNDTRILIVEGWRLEQVVRQINAAEPKLIKFKPDDFLNWAKDPTKFPDYDKYPVLKEIPAGKSMEGFLFPATYDVPVDGNARIIMNQILTLTQRVVDENKLKEAGAKKGLSLYQVFILGSIVEREALNNEDRPQIAAVYLNRMNNPKFETAGLLQADPTVQYGRDTANPPDKYWQPLADKGENIAKNSPWNTYYVKGLPPTPICSPGEDSLKAAANAPDSPYYYFYHNKDHKIVLAKNYQEFQQKLAKDPAG
jgi:UPF0755 protein